MQLDCGPCEVRDWRAEDRPSLLYLAGNRAIWRNLTHSFPHPYTDADAKSWFELLAQTPRPTHWAIDVNGQAVGGIGLDIGVGVFGKSARFGYWLGEPYWGQGLATAAVRATVAHVFAHYVYCAWRPLYSNGMRPRCGCWKNVASRVRACSDRAFTRMAR